MAELGIATVVTLAVVLQLPDAKPVTNQQPVENIGVCYAMARELTARAEAGILRERGGSFAASCRVEVPAVVGH